jgi:ABC-2 type transport system permease protein
VAGRDQPGPGTFARLKLRVLANGFRGQPMKIVVFVLGGLGGLWFAAFGFLGATLSGLPDNPELATIVPAFGGGLLVFGWLFVPLVWTGVDESLDPARFALFPLRRRTLISGLFVAALIGIPALATLVASGGLVIGAARRGGALAAVAELIAVLLGLVLCVVVSRAVTSAFSSLLRSRRTRDLAAVGLAVLAALLGPLQIGVLGTVQRTGAGQLERIAEVVGWTPFGAPYLIGFDVAVGGYAAAFGRLVLTLVVLGLLFRWWASSLESAMLGATASSGGRERRGAAGGAVAQLFPRLLGRLPHNGFGALVARESRYWWRDPRRRASLITVSVLAVVTPLIGNISSFLEGEQGPQAPASLTVGAMMLMGSLAAVALANQFGFDGTAYAAHLVAGVPGRRELAARATAFSLYVVPLLAVASMVVAAVTGRLELFPAMLGGVLAVYGAGLVVNLGVSIFAAYALPENSNPFAINTGSGTAKSLFAFLAMFGALVASAPVVIAALLIDGALTWLLLPVGVGYGAGAVWLGVYILGDVLDRRAPQVLAAVTPRR